jgi:hypothetical protein
MRCFALLARNERAYGWPSVSVPMIQLENHWTNLDEIWYGRYAIRV